eukprot:g1482.t1
MDRMGRKRLMLEYKQMTENPPAGVIAGLISEEDPYRWECLLMGPDDSELEGGCFRAVIDIPRTYPLNPPKMRFTSKMWHPNIYPDGRVCISILHAPGQDQFGYEREEERWSPIQSIDKIILSVLSILADPNDESPANIDAAKMWREDRASYIKIVRGTVRDSLGLSVPEDAALPPPPQSTSN